MKFIKLLLPILGIISLLNINKVIAQDDYYNPNYEKVKSFTWNARTIKDRTIISIDLLNEKLSIWGEFKSSKSTPSVISFTLPGDTKNNKIDIGFSNSYITNKSYDLQKLDFKNSISLTKFYKNNNTLESNIKDGIFLNKKSEKIDLFKLFMKYKYLYISFKDGKGQKNILVPLSYFHKRVLEITSPKPTYSTGNPSDTSLTKNELRDKDVFDDNSIPSSWEIAGISDPINFKHFIKYFRYLVNHNMKFQIAKLIEFPASKTTIGCLSSEDFIKNYDLIFNKTMKDMINSQKLDQLFRTSNGVLLGDLTVILIEETRPNIYKLTGIQNSKR